MTSTELLQCARNSTSTDSKPHTGKQMLPVPIFKARKSRCRDLLRCRELISGRVRINLKEYVLPRYRAASSKTNGGQHPTWSLGRRLMPRPSLPHTPCKDKSSLSSQRLTLHFRDKNPLCNLGEQLQRYANEQRSVRKRRFITFCALAVSGEIRYAHRNGGMRQMAEDARRPRIFSACRF